MLILRTDRKDVDAYVFERHDHTVEMFTQKIRSLIEESDDIGRQNTHLSQAVEDSEMYTARFQEEGEERQIELNGANEMIRILREQNANGDPTLADPRIWLHLRECCERQAQAVHRQEQLDATLEQANTSHDQFYTAIQELVTILWRRIFGLEALVDPSQCPSYLWDGREWIRKATDKYLAFQINDKDPKEDSEVEAEDLQKYGRYFGPTNTPDAWLPSAEISGSQSQADSTESDAAPLGLTAPGTAVPVCTTEDHAAVPPTDDQENSDADPQASIARQSNEIRRLRSLVKSLWGRSWAFEAIIAPEDEDCPARLWDERKVLVRFTLEIAGFEVNRPAPEESASLPLEFGPFCTPEAWMPREDEDDEASGDVDDSGDRDDPGDDDNSGNW